MVQRTLLIIVATVGLTWITVSQAQPVQARTEPLRAVTLLDEPWIIHRDNVWTGFHVALWDAIAGEIGVDYEFTVVKDWEAMINAVVAGTADIAVQHLFVTSAREQIVDFTHSIFDNGMQVLVRRTTSLSSLLGPLATIILWRFIAAGILIVLVVAHLQWLCERKRPDSDFHRSYWRGLWDAVWWSVVTFTTVGYGDYVPKSASGRTVAFVWIFLSLFLVSLFVAELSAVLTVGKIDNTVNSFDDLPGRTVATWPTGVTYESLFSIGATPVTYLATREIVDSLDRGDVEAAFIDIGAATYFASAGPWRIELVGPPRLAGDIAYALRPNSPYLESINRAILVLKENGTYDAIYRRWLGPRQ